MNTEPDYGDDIRRLHEHLDRGHEQLRDNLMQKLREAGVTGGDVSAARGDNKPICGNSNAMDDVCANVGRVTGDALAEPVVSAPQATPQTKRRSKFSLRQKSIATVIVVLVAALVAYSVTTRPAFALRAALDSIRQADSLYLRGYVASGRTEDRFPVEAYTDSSGVIWMNRKDVWYHGDGTYRVIDEIEASDGEIRYRTSHDPGYAEELPKTTRVAARDTPAWAKIDAKIQLGTILGGGVLFGHSHGFRFVGPEDADGISCHVFERDDAGLANSRHRVYIDVASRQVVRAMTFITNDDGSIAKIRWEVEEVVVNPPATPPQISFRPDIDVEVVDLPPTRERFARGNWPQLARLLSVPFALREADGALVCWSENDYERSKHDILPGESQVDFVLVDEFDEVVETEAITLGQTDDGDVVWNWVYLRPNEGSVNFGGFIQISYLTPEKAARGDDAHQWRIPAVDIDDASIDEVFSTMSSSSGDLNLDKLRAQYR